MRLSILVVTLLFIVPLKVNAGFHLEPYLGMSVDGDWSMGTKDDASMSEFGVKLGYQANSGFQIGGDLQMGIGEYKNLFGVPTQDAGHAAFGLYLGYQSAIGLRGYVHYLFSSALAFDDLTQTQIAGSGFKFGIGYSLLSWLALNLEFHSMTYGKYKFNTDSSFSALDPELKNDLVLVVLSFPFNFGGGGNHEESRSLR